jgi:hypothetical protein
MRHQDRPTAVAVAVAVRMPSSQRSNFVDVTRSMLTGAPGTTTDLGAAITYGLLFWALLAFDAGRARLARFIRASTHRLRRNL